jgi:hypothetical protein
MDKNAFEMTRRMRVKIVEPIGSLIKLRNPGFFACDKNGNDCTYIYPCKVVDNKPYIGYVCTPLYFNEYTILLDDRLYMHGNTRFVKVLCQHCAGFVETVFLDLTLNNP